MSYDDPFGTKRLDPGALEHFVVEWGLEDSARYDRVSGRARERPMKPRSGLGKGIHRDPKPEREPWEETTIAVVVLEFPRQKTDYMTSKLRTIAKRDGNGWLSKASAYAEESWEVHDELARKDLHLQALMTLVRELAKDVADLGRPGESQRMEQKMVELANEYYSLDRTDVVSMMRKALREKKTEVAAKLLAAIDDDDDLKFGR